MMFFMVAVVLVVVVCNAPDNTLQGMTEDQLEAYLYGAQLLIDTQTTTDQADIRQYFLRKDKAELDPGENNERHNG
jgi:hypothetical protein